MKYIFDERESTPLCEIMGRNKSDKGNEDIKSSWHNYTTFYYSIFKERCKEKLRIFELGIGTNNPQIACNMGINGRPGASLYGWEEFFPNSEIYGADIDKKIIFNTERIKTYYCDQTNAIIIKEMWNKKELEEKFFDIIIEDGLHTYDANVCFFENSIEKLNSKGYYIIEDINTKDEERYINKIKEWENQYKDCSFTLLKIPSSFNTYNNNLLVIYKS